jgi:hypothetical protein
MNARFGLVALALAAGLVAGGGSLALAQEGPRQNVETATYTYRHTWEKAGEGQLATTFQERYWGLDSGRPFLGFEREDILAHERHLEGMRRAGYREVAPAQVVRQGVRDEIRDPRMTGRGVPGLNQPRLNLPGTGRRPQPAIEPEEPFDAQIAPVAPPQVRTDPRDGFQPGQFPPALPPDAIIGPEPREETTDLEGSADGPSLEPESELPSELPPPFVP